MIILLLVAILVTNLILFWEMGNILYTIEAKIDYLLNKVRTYEHNRQSVIDPD